MNLTANEIRNIVTEATDAAYAAADAFEKKYFPDNGWGACGFAWVDIFGIKGNTKLGRAMKAAGITKDYKGAYSIWNPSEHRGQSMDVKEVGAQACAQVFKNYGFTAYMDSRAD